MDLEDKLLAKGMVLIFPLCLGMCVLIVANYLVSHAIFGLCMIGQTILEGKKKGGKLFVYTSIYLFFDEFVVLFLS